MDPAERSRDNLLELVDPILKVGSKGSCCDMVLVEIIQCIPSLFMCLCVTDVRALLFSLEGSSDLLENDYLTELVFPLCF